jgi:hypothetical protein
LDKTAKSLQLYEQYKKQKKKRSKPSSWEITHCSLFSWDISHCLLTSYLIYISSIYCYSSISSDDTSQPHFRRIRWIHNLYVFFDRGHNFN